MPRPLHPLVKITGPQGSSAFFAEDINLFFLQEMEHFCVAYRYANALFPSELKVLIGISERQNPFWLPILKPK
jgi:hypothetical protein